ncbi:DUF3667 domain-containing protein [Sphingomonas sp. 7/4-4]|uniref:DUF3667 domain-containing protein n=1 Tax=Sphingomonas sp. 7/4-4 TaxID=3018446 RepID=UPI003FA7077F
MCLNCGTALIGAHCHHCGQSGHVHRSLGAVGHEIVHGVFHFEGKFWRTLPLLAWRPGDLTRRYVAGSARASSRRWRSSSSRSSRCSRCSRSRGFHPRPTCAASTPIRSRRSRPSGARSRSSGRRRCARPGTPISMPMTARTRSRTSPKPMRG